MNSNFRDTKFSEQWKAKLQDDAMFSKLSAHLDQAIQSVETNSPVQGTSADEQPASLDLKPFLDVLNKEVLQLVGAYITTTCVYTRYKELSLAFLQICNTSFVCMLYCVTFCCAQIALCMFSLDVTRVLI